MELSLKQEEASLGRQKPPGYFRGSVADWKADVVSLPL